MREKKSWKVFPFEYCDVEYMQAWLEDRAREGLYLTGFTLRWAKFERKAPCSVRYRLEPVQRDTQEPDGELLELYEAYGWRYVAPLRGEYFVFMTTDEIAREPHTDPQSLLLAMKKSMKRQRIGGWLELAEAIILMAVFLGAAAMQKEPLLELIHMGTLWIGYLFLLLLFLAGSGAVKLIQLRRFQRTLRAGRPMQGSVQYQKRVRRWYWSFAGGMAVIVLVLLCPHMLKNRPAKMDTEQYDASLPFLQLQELDPDTEMEMGGMPYKAVDLMDYVTAGSDMLAPEYLKLFQSGTPVAAPEQERTHYWVEYYEAASAPLARQLAMELEQRHPRADASFQLQADGLEGVDYGAYYCGPEGQFLLLQAEERVEIVYYDGPLVLGELLPRYLERWQLSIPVM